MSADGTEELAYSNTNLGKLSPEEKYELGKTAAMEILGEDHSQDAWLIQHGREAFRPGEPAKIVAWNQDNAMWAVRYDDGHVDRISMVTPVVKIGEARWPIKDERRTLFEHIDAIGEPKLWCEMCQERSTRKARKVVGRG